MAQDLVIGDVPVPENVLRDLAKNVSKTLPRFEIDEPAASVK